VTGPHAPPAAAHASSSGARPRTPSLSVSTWIHIARGPLVFSAITDGTQS
jgi:hypothetical protein